MMRSPEKKKCSSIKLGKTSLLRTARIYIMRFLPPYITQPGKKALKLWRKNKVKKANAETVSENLEIVREVEANEGKSWIDKIYQANGLKKPGKAVKNG